MYSGPGSAPLLAAMTAWDGLAAELRSTVAAYQKVITVLTGDDWLGPASESMAAAAAPYLAWMSITGMQAEQTAAQAAAAAAAFESAFAMTVPPAVVAANRTQLAALVATNVLGQNTPAIAATEAAYGEMWAQDAAAMYGYAASSATAAALSPFTEPVHTTNPGGQANQAAAVTQAAGGAGFGLAQSKLPQLMALVPNALQGLASPAAAAAAPAQAIPGLDALNSALAGPAGWLAAILNFLDGNDGNPYGIFMNSSLVNGFTSAGYVSPAIVGPAVWTAMADVNAVALGAQNAPLPPMGSGEGNPTWLPGISPASPESLPPLSETPVASWGAGEVSAGTNQAALVGRLSVPQSWMAATAVANHAGAAAPGGGWTSSATVPEAAAGMPGVPGMPAVFGHSFGNAPRYGFRPTIMGRPPAAG